MVEIYTKFNKMVHNEFFIESNAGTTVTILSVGNFFMNKCADELGLTVHSLLQNIRQYLRNGIDDILGSDNEDCPKFLGYIALQIYAAYQMQDDEDFTSRAYYPQFDNLLRWDYASRCKIFEKYQETLWSFLKTWAAKIDIQILIPENKKGRNRYVQFPLSQALLNNKDLLTLPQVFSDRGLSPYDEISFDDFISILRPFSSYKMSSRFNRLYNELDKQNLIHLQIFRYFQTWNGERPISEKKSVYSKGSRNVIKELKYLVLSFEKIKYLRLIDDSNKNIINYNFNEKQLINKIKFQIKRLHPYNLLIFKKDEDYGDWIESRWIDIGEDFIVLTDSLVLKKGFQNFASSYVLLGYYYILKVHIKKDEFYHLTGVLPNFIRSKKHPIRLVSGLKLGRKTWMTNAGPCLIVESDLIKYIWIDGTKKEITENELSLREYVQGEHLINIPNYSTIYFNISDSNSQLLFHTKSGWKINKQKSIWEFTDFEPDVTGLILSFKRLNSGQFSPVQEWIKALTNRSVPLTSKHPQLELPDVVKTLRRSNYNNEK